MTEELHADLRGWWRITETSQWVNDGLDDLGPAMLSITGRGDRLRMHSLLAYVNWRPTKTGASFTWEGAWEYNPMRGIGSVRIAKDGRLRGRNRRADTRFIFWALNSRRVGCRFNSKNKPSARAQRPRFGRQCWR